MHILATEIDFSACFLRGEYNPSGHIFTDIYLNNTGFGGNVIVTNYRIIFFPLINQDPKKRALKISVHLMSIMMVTLKAPSTQVEPIGTKLTSSAIKLTLKDLREIKFAHLCTLPILHPLLHPFLL